MKKILEIKNLFYRIGLTDNAEIMQNVDRALILNLSQEHKQQIVELLRISADWIETDLACK